MHNPKLRVYLFAVLMFRTYLEHFDGINEMHIRSGLQLFLSLSQHMSSGKIVLISNSFKYGVCHGTNFSFKTPLLLPG